MAFIDINNDGAQDGWVLVNISRTGIQQEKRAMTEENRKEQEQEKKEELTEKDLDQASGGLMHGPNSVHKAEINVARPSEGGGGGGNR
jgi:ribosomal protein L29